MADDKQMASEARAAAAVATQNPAAPETGRRTWRDVLAGQKRSDVPAGLWTRCPSCEAMLYRKTVEQNLHVCPHCEHHFRIDADERIRQLCDPDSFEELWAEMRSLDVLGFEDQKKYGDRLRAETAKTGRNDAVRCGRGYIKGRPVVLAAMDGRFMMGSMGSVVGEKITRAIELATEEDKPLIVVSCSGGARMQEGILSLMQMASTSAEIALMREARLPYLSILTNPTMGGVTASFAMLGDVHIAEPGSLIGFAGERVIRETIRQQLPPGFQRAEFLLEKGFVDLVAPRSELKATVARVLSHLYRG
jgi:acetyl-CoA carboxylase carboxyl transferase subunit beta